MDITAAEPDTLKSDATHDHGICTNEVEFVQRAGVEDLNVETVTSNPLLPTDRKWAIRFRADGTVTIVLGMRDYGRGWFSTYFASLVTARLGIPSQRVRIHYSATLPAVLQTPMPPAAVFHRSDVGPVASAIADIIEDMCDQVVQKGRQAFAAIAGVGASDVGFDQQTSRFFVLDRNRIGEILEIGETVRGGFPIMTEFARKLRRTDHHAISGETEVQPAA